MSQLAVANVLSNAATLLNSGVSPKGLISDLYEVADTATLEILANCMKTLENFPHETAVEMLRGVMERPEFEAHKDLIAACIPEADNGMYRPPVTTSRRGDYRPPRDSRTRIDPNRRAQRQQRDTEPSSVTAYMHTRAGVDDDPKREDRPDGYANDCEQMASRAMRGYPCLACVIERPTITEHTRSGQPDDGLCDTCREAGRPGMPGLPGDSSRDDLINAMCDHARVIHTSRAATVAVLRQFRRHLSRYDLTVMTQWLRDHPEETGPTGFPRSRMVAARCAFVVATADTIADAHSVLLQMWNAADTEDRTAIAAWTHANPWRSDETTAPTGYSRRETIAAECAHVAATAESVEAARAALNLAWRDATADDQAIIREWARRNPLPAAPSAPPASTPQADAPPVTEPAPPVPAEPAPAAPHKAAPRKRKAPAKATTDTAAAPSTATKARRKPAARKATAAPQSTEPPASAAAEVPAAAEPPAVGGACATCGKRKQVRRGACAECRAIGIEPAEAV